LIAKAINDLATMVVQVEASRTEAAGQLLLECRSACAHLHGVNLGEVLSVWDRRPSSGLMLAALCPGVGSRYGLGGLWCDDLVLERAADCKRWALLLSGWPLAVGPVDEDAVAGE